MPRQFRNYTRHNGVYFLILNEVNIMCRIKLFFAMFLFFFPNFALSQVKQVNSVGTSPLPWLSGVINGSYERRIKPEIGLGLNGFTWNYISSDWEFSILGIGPHGRYYFGKENDGAFVGGSISLITYSWSGWGLSGSGSIMSLGGEGGYQWKWVNFYNEVTLGLAMAGNIETPGGTSANVGSAIGGIGYKLGWYF